VEHLEQQVVAHQVHDRSGAPVALQTWQAGAVAAIDIAGFVSELKDHAIDHGFHVHDERHIIETYSLRQSWEVDLHPESGCGRPLDLHLALDVDPRVLLALQDKLEEMADEWEEPPDEYHFDLFFNWAVPPLSEPPDLLVLATDLAGIGGVAPIPLRRPEVEDALVGVSASDRTAIERAARRATEGADPLPQTSHKVPLLEALVADVVESAAAGDAHTEAGRAERGLPTKSGRL
jgi:hypothetical protein